MLNYKNIKINFKSSLDLFCVSMTFIFSKNFGISFEDIEVRSGIILPKLSISKKTKITVKTTNIFALKKRLCGKNLNILSNLFNL